MHSAYFRSQVTRYITLFVERSGSTYLATLLGSHPSILAKREEFAHMRQRGINGAGQLEWAQQFWRPPLFGLHKAIGFKTKLADVLDQAGFSRLLVDYHVCVIQLQRRNIVKAAISTINAQRLHEKSGNWNLLKEPDRLPAFQVDPQEFDRLLHERIRWDQELEDYASSLNLRRIRLYYEDLLRDEKSFLTQVFNFIKVKPRPVQGKTLKNTKDDLREVILNFEEIRAQCADTPYQSMFDEVIL